MDCLGSILCEDAVCRADVVASITGSSLGDEVTPKIVGQVMGDRGLWCHAMPDTNLRFYVALNKMDLITKESSAAVVAAVYDRRDSGPGPGLVGIAAVLLMGNGQDGFGAVLGIEQRQ